MDSSLNGMMLLVEFHNPQRTILGPILFIMYINDLPGVCKHIAIVYLFADDAKLYKRVLCDDDHKSLQCGLNALQEWSDKWLLKLNASKCKTVFYGRNIGHGYKYSLHSAELENTPTI